MSGREADIKNDMFKRVPEHELNQTIKKVDELEIKHFQLHFCQPLEAVFSLRPSSSSQDLYVKEDWKTKSQLQTNEIFF